MSEPKLDGYRVRTYRDGRPIRDVSLAEHIAAGRPKPEPSLNPPPPFDASIPLPCGWPGLRPAQKEGRHEQA
jgi:hypothetical protein